ncbi:MAG: glutamate-1-semialdehyde 2,1-aminomutase [Gallionella sp.]|nr:glutamate-1-semialdehyde 2,1-aminomutase [Gallionella sp.]
MSNYSKRLNNVIPGGAHTYSRGDDQFPSNAPQILVRGKGVHVFDPEGRRYLDYGMALRAITVGYAEDEIDSAAIAQIKNGNNLTRASIIELEAAELLVDLIDSVDMVKFTKNGSTAVSAAVKLSRAYTGRDLVARCAEHPFFSYDDWFIGSTQLTRGIPQDTIEKTKLFRYNDIASLEELIAQHPGQLACVVLEPATSEEPKEGFLQQVQELCRMHGIVFVLDEMITGFRWHMKGAQHLYGVKPDLCTFGKAMANGFSVACVAGRREIMELGGIEHEGRERVFLLSTTHGGEMSGLGAFVATIGFMQRHKVVEHMWDYGRRLVAMMQRQADAHGIGHSFKAGGVPCSPYYLTLDASGANSLGLRTLFSQEMIRNGVLMPWITLAYRHGEEELAITERAIDQTFSIYCKALEEGVGKYLEGPIVKPVFRKYN